MSVGRIPFTPSKISSVFFSFFRQCTAGITRVIKSGVGCKNVPPLGVIMYPLGCNNVPPFTCLREGVPPSILLTLGCIPFCQHFTGSTWNDPNLWRGGNSRRSWEIRRCWNFAHEFCEPLSTHYRTVLCFLPDIWRFFFFFIYGALFFARYLAIFFFFFIFFYIWAIRNPKLRAKKLLSQRVDMH